MLRSRFACPPGPILVSRTTPSTPRWLPWSLSRPLFQDRHVGVHHPEGKRVESEHREKKAETKEYSKVSHLLSHYGAFAHKQMLNCIFRACYS